MAMKKIMTWLALLAALGWAGAHWWLGRPLRHGPGVLAPGGPRQTTITKPEPIRHKGYRITPVAEFEVEARVLSARRYFLDREARLSRVDLALGWGPMSDERNLDEIKVSQSGRFYRWRTRSFPIPRGEIERNSANMHMIPATLRIGRLLMRARPGHLIRLSGYLVNIRGKNGWRWKSSVRRSDTGHGACEVVWVKELELESAGSQP